MTDVSRISESSLKKFCMDALMTTGIPESDARDVASVMLFADKRGVASHGCSALPGYMHHLRLGNLNPSPNIRIVADYPAYAIVDGDGGLGALTAIKCARIAAEKGSKSGIGFVAARNSNHFGAASYYALIMAEAGMIGEVISNVQPVMAPTGSRARALGNNPYAVAAPTRGPTPFVFDMATSVAAGRKIFAAAEAGEAIPRGWLLDLVGNPSTDPRDFARGGALVPFGGHKGYGLALAFEVFSGVLTGAGIGSQIERWKRGSAGSGGIGHTFRVINIASFMPLDMFYDRMDLLIAQMKTAKPASGGSEILIPGELAYKNQMASTMLGVPIAKKTRSALIKLAADLRIEPPV